MEHDEYFFIEWLILSKNLTSEEYAKLTEDEYYKLVKEYENFCKELK